MEHFLISHECSMFTGSTVIATILGTIKIIHLSLYHEQQNDPKSSMTKFRRMIEPT